MGSRSQVGLAAGVLIAGTAGALFVSRFFERSVVAITPTFAAALGEIEHRAFPRPVHRGTAVAGTFGDALTAEAWGAMETMEVALRGDPKTLVGPCGPLAPRPQLDLPGCRAALDATRSELPRLLAATLRADGSLGAAQGALAPLVSNRPLEVPAEVRGATGAAPVESPTLERSGRMLAVCKRGALAMDESVAQGDGAGAARLCADTMAWARDMSFGSSLIGSVAGRACVEVALPACEATRGAASAEDRKGLGRELRVIRAAMPDVLKTARDDLRLTWLVKCGPFLEPEGVRALSPLAQKKATEAAAALAASGQSVGLLERWRGATECREEESSLEGLASMTDRELAATYDVAKYRDAQDDAYRRLDGLIAEAER